MEIKNLIVDEDLTGYLSTKDNINTFINFCIRERQKAEFKMSTKRVRTLTIAELENRHLNPEKRNNAAHKNEIRILTVEFPKTK